MPRCPARGPAVRSRRRWLHSGTALEEFEGVQPTFVRLLCQSDDHSGKCASLRSEMLNHACRRGVQPGTGFCRAFVGKLRTLNVIEKCSLADLAVNVLEIRRRLLDEGSGEFLHNPHPRNVEHSARQILQEIVRNGFLARQKQLVVLGKRTKTFLISPEIDPPV